MKKTTKKLQLNTESIRVLTKDDLDLVAGGMMDGTGRGTETRGISCTCPVNACNFDPSEANCLG